jgi:hypothetical protein
MLKCHSSQQQSALQYHITAHLRRLYQFHVHNTRKTKQCHIRHKLKRNVYANRKKIRTSQCCHCSIKPVSLEPYGRQTSPIHTQRVTQSRISAPINLDAGTSMTNPHTQHVLPSLPHNALIVS